MIQKFYIMLICFLAWMLVIHPSFTKSLAQTEGGSISGVIKDSESNTVPGITIIALLKYSASPSSSKSFEVISNDEGNYKFSNLPGGVYDIQVKERWLFKPETKMNIRVRQSQNTNVNFRLKVVRPCEGNASETNSVSDSDKAEIIRLVLEDALVKKEIPDYNLLTEGKENIILSTQNIRSNWVPSLPGYKLILMSPAEIQKKADFEGDFLHLSFVVFKVKGSCVAVTLANSWAVGKHSGMGYLSGGGFTYEYRKQSGKWVGKGISGWIS
jgi:hypothetical protein